MPMTYEPEIGIMNSMPDFGAGFPCRMHLAGKSSANLWHQS